MKIAVTGGTGFIGRELVQQLVQAGHQLRCWFRAENYSPEELNEIAGSDGSVEWIDGTLGDGQPENLIAGCEAVVHSAFWRPGQGFQGEEGDIVQFARTNILGTLELIQASVAANLKKFIFVSTCAVHDKILDDRPLDEAHPLWPRSHYGAHKAALEKFVHSYGLGEGFPICSLRPTGVYGLRRPIEKSKWFSLVKSIVAGENVEVTKGGKEVHVSDVAKSIRLLLSTDASIAGESYACYDRYVSQHEVATMAKKITGSCSEIAGEPASPKHQIDAGKIKSLGMEFGGTRLLEETLQQLCNCV